MRSLLLLFHAVLAGASAQAQCELSVDVTVENPAAGGTLRLALCPNASAYDTEKGCRVAQEAVRSSRVSIMFPDIPEGRYAIKAFHDVNDSGALDTNWMGIPNEPYGFSNDARGTFGPPSFEDAAITVKAGANHTSFRTK